MKRIVSTTVILLLCCTLAFASKREITIKSSAATVKAQLKQAFSKRGWKIIKDDSKGIRISAGAADASRNPIRGRSWACHGPCTNRATIKLIDISDGTQVIIESKDNIDEIFDVVNGTRIRIENCFDGCPEHPNLASASPKP